MSNLTDKLEKEILNILGTPDMELDQSKEKSKIKLKFNIDFKLPICEILFVIFVVLKITEVINWSWWLVFIPIYIEFGILITVFLIAALAVWLAGHTDEDGE